MTSALPHVLNVRWILQSSCRPLCKSRRSQAGEFHATPAFSMFLSARADQPWPDLPRSHIACSALLLTLRSSPAVAAHIVPRPFSPISLFLRLSSSLIGSATPSRSSLNATSPPSLACLAAYLSRRIVVLDSSNTVVQCFEAPSAVDDAAAAPAAASVHAPAAAPAAVGPPPAAKSKKKAPPVTLLHPLLLHYNGDWSAAAPLTQDQLELVSHHLHRFQASKNSQYNEQQRASRCHSCRVELAADARVYHCCACYFAQNSEPTCWFAISSLLRHWLQHRRMQWP